MVLCFENWNRSEIVLLSPQLDILICVVAGSLVIDLPHSGSHKNSTEIGSV